MVAFFKSQKCPQGWSSYDLVEGRYIVGTASTGKVEEMIGNKLSPNENRPTGLHTHETTVYKIQHNGISEDGLDTKFRGSSNVKINVAFASKTNKQPGLKRYERALYHVESMYMHVSG